MSDCNVIPVSAVPPLRRGGEHLTDGIVAVAKSVASADTPFVHGIEHLLHGDQFGWLGEADALRFGHEAEQSGFDQVLRLFLYQRYGQVKIDGQFVDAQRAVPLQIPPRQDQQQAQGQSFSKRMGPLLPKQA